MAAHRDTLGRLYRNVAERARFRLGGLDIDTLHALRRYMGEEFILKGYFLRQQLVGVSMGFVNGDTLEAGLVGIDYGLNRTHAIYPRMLYDYLRSAMSRGLARVNYGRTASGLAVAAGTFVSDILAVAISALGLAQILTRPTAAPWVALASGGRSPR